MAALNATIINTNEVDGFLQHDEITDRINISPPEQKE